VQNRGFYCGAGGARMWMEERIGKRINTERIDEAVGTDPDTISTACPYCLVMLGDTVAAKKRQAKPKTPSRWSTSPRSSPAPPPSITITRTFRSNPLVRSVNKFALRSGFVN
jgi:Fe-S oxidoreductase